MRKDNRAKTKSTPRELKVRAREISASCGPDVPAEALARRDMAIYTPLTKTPTGETGYKHVAGGYLGRLGVRERDVFDRMNDNATRGTNKIKPFSEERVAIARSYQALFEFCQTTGAKGQSFEAIGSGGGSESRMDHYIQERQRLERCDAMVGEGYVGKGLAVAPSLVEAAPGVAKRLAEKGARHAISDLDLVRMVCGYQMSLTDVLKERGWGMNGKNRKKLRDSLCASLDRIGSYIGT